MIQTCPELTAGYYTNNSFKNQNKLNLFFTYHKFQCHQNSRKKYNGNNICKMHLSQKKKEKDNQTPNKTPFSLKKYIKCKIQSQKDQCIKAHKSRQTIWAELINIER